jgi:hypothetical protein
METTRKLLYVDITHVYQAGESILMREPNWVPQIRPKFTRILKGINLYARNKLGSPVKTYK